MATYYFCCKVITIIFAVYRIVSVCVIGKFINWSSDVNLLNKRTLTIMSWGGLRGAVSFVMAQHLATSCKTSYVLS